MTDLIYLYHIPTPVKLPDGSDFIGSQMISIVKADKYDMTKLVAMNIEGKIKYATKEFLDQHPYYNDFVIK